MTTAGCAYAEANCLGALSSSEATVVFATEPLWAAAFAWWALSETVRTPRPPSAPYIYHAHSHSVRTGALSCAQMGPSAMLGGGLIVSACLVSAAAESAAVQRAWSALAERARASHRAIVSEGKPSVGLLGLLSPAAVEAIENFGDIGADLGP